jgi:hypothetical protein
MVGGAIRNAVATAAFLAAEEGKPIGPAQVTTAVQREMQKLGRLFDADEIGLTNGRPRPSTARGRRTSRPAGAS